MRRVLILMIALLWPVSAVSQAPPPPSQVQILEDVTRTKHNLSAVEPREILSSGIAGTSRDVFSPETAEICVFCHTPHGANPTATSQLRAPLWNRSLSEASYQLYDQVWSRSFEGKLNPGAPTGYSRLCLSCHDGTIALGAIRNAPGSGGFNPNPETSPPLQMQYASGVTPPFPFGSIPEGSGTATGNTRRLGTDLRNDHPISFVYDNALASVDRELTVPGNFPIRPASEPLYPTGIGPMRRYPGTNFNGSTPANDSIQCTSCHNPHQVNYPKFLRANWLHNAPEHSGEQIICLFCHDKPGWIESTHSVATAIRNKYPIVNSRDDPASGYDFDGSHSVGQYACRNCHDPHTAQGAKRLHREGIDTPGGLDAIENTCYLCHAPNTQAIPFTFAPAGDPTTGSNPRFLAGTGRPAPDIYTQFAKDRSLGGSGSAMNLRLAQGHEPVFTSYPREGVELNSPFPPPFNKFAPGSGPGGSPPSPDISPDQRHVECVDCHNPHQVVASNRLKGMRGITFNGLVVGHDSQEAECMPGPCNREPYVYEVCFRCHGNSVSDLFRGDRFPEDTQYRSNPLRPVTHSSLSMEGFSNKRLEFATYGNAMAETSATSDPQRGSYVEGDPWGTGLKSDGTPDPDAGRRRVGPGVHKAFHPVVASGRNRTAALDKQLREGTNQRLTVNSTIHCTDCHNNDRYDAYNNGTTTQADLRFVGPLTESNLRGTDAQNPVTLDVYNPRTQEDPNNPGPIGPHGSKHIRILRANYNTDIANPSRRYAEDGFIPTHFNNFLLCFQCHDRRAFDPNVSGAAVNDPSWTNFFGYPPNPEDPAGPGQLSWESNLHMYHLVRTGAYCHECHYNVHSNVQANNTIYGDGSGCIGGTPGCPAGLPPDEEDGVVDGVSDTHLINFAPGGPTTYTGERRCEEGPEPSDRNADFFNQVVGNPCPQDETLSGDPNPGVGSSRNIFEGVEGVTADRPVWYFDASFNPPRFRCNLRCHGVVMSTCFYVTTTTPGYPAFDPNFSMNLGSPNSPASAWCAGGQEQRARINFGSLPPEIKELVAKADPGQSGHDHLPEKLKAYVDNLKKK